MTHKALFAKPPTHVVHGFIKKQGEGRGAYLSDVLAHVLDDHFIGCNGLHGEKAPLVDPAASEPQLLLSELQRRQTKEIGRSFFDI